jgi:hypothetical protein
MLRRPLVCGIMTALKIPSKTRIKILTYPRSGSRFTARLLKSLGCMVEQERLGADGTVSWVHAGTGTVRGRTSEFFEAGIVLHQVREPLAAITSASTMSASSFLYLSRNSSIPLNCEIRSSREERLLFCLKVYPIWHDLILSHNPEWRYRIESLNSEDIWGEFCDRLGVAGKWEEMGKSVRHSRVHLYETVCTWDEAFSLDSFAAGRVRELAAGYGYDYS